MEQKADTCDGDVRNCRRQLLWLQFACAVFVVVGEAHVDVGLVVLVKDGDREEEEGGTRQFKRSNAIVPRMLTKWLEMYFRLESMVLLLRGLSVSNTPITTLSSEICPSFRKAVRMFGRVKFVPLLSVPSIPGPEASNSTREFRKGSIILEGRSVPGPVP